MPHRAQRRRNREAREAPQREAAEFQAWLDFADTTLAMRREFVAEAIKSRGLVSLTFRPRGESHILEVKGGEVTTDGTSKLHGDGIVNDWALMSLKGYRVWFNENSAVIARNDPTYRSIDVSNIWLRTVGQLLQPEISTAGRGAEEYIAVTRDGFTLLSQTLDHEALAQSLQYVQAQLFESDT